MTVYVDAVFTATPREAQAARLGTRWSHMIADSRAELDAMATRIGLKLRYRQHSDRATEHYDLTPPRRALAIRAGAVELTRREMGHKLSERSTRQRAYEEPLACQDTAEPAVLPSRPRGGRSGG